MWGGEVLLASYDGFQRVGSLYPFTLPGGDRAAVYPVRALIGLMAAAGMSLEEVLGTLSRLGLLGKDKLPYGEREAVVSYRVAVTLRRPIATSMGRTLDAFSALLRVCWYRGYEGEPAMRLEAAARGGRDLGYTPPIRQLDGRLVVDTRELLGWVLEGMERGRSVRDLAMTILKGLGRALGEIAARAAKGVDGPVFLSGGAAVNTYIVRGVREALAEYGLTAVLPKRLPPGDGGIAVGQLAVASARLGLLEA